MQEPCFCDHVLCQISIETQGLLWPEAINTTTKLGNSLPKSGESLDPYTKCYGEDAKKHRILDYLQPFGRVAYITNRTKIKAKLDPKSFKCIFVGYADDHSGDTYKFYNPATKQTILSRDVHQWMEWHGRITATDDLPLFTQLKQLEEDSVIVPASAIVPHVSDVNDDDVDDLLNDDMPPLVARTAEERGPILPEAAAFVDPPAWRNLAASFSPAVTRSRTRDDSGRTSDADIRSDNVAAVSAITRSQTRDNSGKTSDADIRNVDGTMDNEVLMELALNASL